MTRTVRVRPRANRDIDTTLQYLAQEAPQVGPRFLESLSSAFTTLAVFPEVRTPTSLPSHRQPHPGRPSGARSYPIPRYPFMRFSNIRASIGTFRST